MKKTKVLHCFLLSYETMSEFEKYKLAYHVGGIYNNLLFWFHRDMKETPREMVDISLRILQEGYQPNVHN